MGRLPWHAAACGATAPAPLAPPCPTLCSLPPSLPPSHPLPSPCTGQLAGGRPLLSCVLEGGVLLPGLGAPLFAGPPMYNVREAGREDEGGL